MPRYLYRCLSCAYEVEETLPLADLADTETL